MIVPSFSPPTYKFRNKCQINIKYTNYDYSKSKFNEICPFKRKNKNMKRTWIPWCTRDLAFYEKNFLTTISL
ncbi:hypothetical protein CUC43_31450 (plasmid) [Bacillus thuringiensis LM1212]|nr:hypothetical protein CUC43_31450 [Bacillus thuringiensis LM1212]QDF27366.1 hypothetical protein FJR70_31860 [Bacillus tropicus]